MVFPIKSSLFSPRSGSASHAKTDKDPYSVPGCEHYGKHCFTGKLADKYLRKHGSSADILRDPKWIKNEADVVAAAVLDWATDHGATNYCHWFQPLASSGFRHGLSAQVYNMMFKFNHKNNVLEFDFKGSDLVTGETDGSSYNSGGLRETHMAGGYLALDTSSPIFLRGDTIFIPSVFVSYFGIALDEKTPLLRANDAMSKHGTRLLKHLGFENAENVGLKANIGLEQEFFLIPRDQYYRRPDLQYTGRTLMGSMPPRNQEMCDHYMAPLSAATPALACLKEIQDECFKMGIPLKTRHREVGPNQFELSPDYGINNIQIDHNLVVMQLIDEIAAKHGLAALLQEKPFEGINGSGKHNNWSISTGSDIPLFIPGPITKATSNGMAFPVIMAAVLSAIDDHGDLMRMAIASPGNDFRLGCMEAPPAIISTYLGDDLTKYLEAFKDGNKDPYSPDKNEIDIGIDNFIPIHVPPEDRNRTSPFPYGGARFEFRAVGSSQNVSMVNTVLNTICAEKFCEFADRIDGGEDAIDVARDALKKHWKVIFNGNCYDSSNREKLTEDGLWRIDSGVEAIRRLGDEKNIKLFEEMKVMTKDESMARQMCFHNHYTGTVETEAGAFIDMVNHHVIPSVQAANVGPLKDLECAVQTLKAALKEIRDTEDSYEKATLARILRLDTMAELRKFCDAAEEVVPHNLWTLATYKELLFLDSHWSYEK